MELRDIEILLTLAEELHFGRTAERLHVSQARVSQAVKKQERRIGAPLFERSSRRVELTPIGAKLVEDLRPVHQGLKDGLERAALAAQGRNGVLRLGIMGAVGHEIRHALAAFRTRYPGCELRIREAHMSDPFGPLRAGDVDVQVVWLPVREPDLTVGPILFRETLVLAVNAGHPLASQSSVTYEDMADHTLIDLPPTAPDYWKDAKLPRRTPSGRPIRRGPVISTLQELLGAVATGEALAPAHEQASRYYARPDIVFLPIEGAPPTEWALVWRTTGETGFVRALAHLVEEAEEDVRNWDPSQTAGEGIS